MKILVTGATGFIGRIVVMKLIEGNHHVVALSRDIEKAKEILPTACEVYAWDAIDDTLPVSALIGIDGVINLQGEPIAKLWTKENKKRIYDSRVLGTKKIIQILKSSPFPMKFFIQASAIGYYSDEHTDEWLDEKGAPGTGFLSGVCVAWERELLLLPESVRRVIFRFGLVLGGGGVLKSMIPSFKLGLGATIGDGKQWMSWIHIEDLVNAILFAVEKETLVGTYNLVSEAPVSNREFTKTLAKILFRPQALFVPKILVKMALSDLATLLIGSQRIDSKKIVDAGFKFKYRDLESALKSLIERS